MATTDALDRVALCGGYSITVCPDGFSVSVWATPDGDAPIPFAHLAHNHIARLVYGEASRRALDVVDGMARWVLDPTDPDANRAAWH